MHFILGLAAWPCRQWFNSSVAVLTMLTLTSGSPGELNLLLVAASAKFEAMLVHVNEGAPMQ